MRSMHLLRHTGILIVFAMLSAAAGPAFADDASGSGKDKKATTSQQKAKTNKNKAGSAANKETPPPAYPNFGAPSY
jgi:hypothetical protein